MVDKVELIEFLDFLKKYHKEENILRCSVPEYGEGFSNLVSIITNDMNGSDTYYLLGNSMSTQDSQFNNIVFREDCYEYLWSIEFDKMDAYDLMQGIRKGTFSRPKFDCFRNRLSDEFVEWADGVKYLPSRLMLFDIFKVEYEVYKYDNALPMPRKTRELVEISEVYDKAEKTPDTLYAQPFINWNGSFEDKPLGKRVVITDRIAEWMNCSNILDYVKRVEMPEDKTYLVETHNGQPTTETKNSNREEELFAMGLFNKKIYFNSDIHSFVDYQVPICRDSNNTQENLGKIDLVSVSNKDKLIYIMELKKCDSDETLLRCAAEIYTYYSQIDKERLTAEVVNKMNLGSSDEYELKPAVLVFKGQLQHLQYKSELYSNVRRYMRSCGIRMFVIDSEISYDSKNIEEYIDKCEIKEVI